MQSPSNEVEALLAVNKAPSEDVAHEVRKLLLRPTQELEDINSEIQELERHLQELKTRGEIVENVVTGYSSILSPIRRIPPDVLSEIFIHCLSDSHNPLMLATEAPVLLTRICSSWRSIALTLPRLWSRIHITYINQNLLYDNSNPRELAHGYPSSKLEPLLRSRCEAVEEWLCRSGACPLSISICYTGTFWEQGFNSFLIPCDLSNRLFKILTSVADRWQHLELALPIETFNQLKDGVTTSPLANLITMRLKVVGGRQDASRIIEGCKLFRAPNLRRLSLDFKISHTISDWKNLTSVSFHVALPIREIATILSKCHALIYFKVLIMNIRGAAQHDSGNISSFQLPHLRTLYIMDYAGEYSKNLYQYIEAPELLCLSYVAEARHNPSIPHIFNESTVPITTLLRKSTKMKKLEIDMRGYADSEVREVFRSADTVKLLVLGPVQRRHVDGRRLLLGNTSDFRNVLLSVSGTSGSTQEQSLFPYLETLQITTEGVMDVPDETFLEFIINRMEPLPSNIYSALRHVDARFGRPEGLNIKEHVQKYADSVGIASNIKLHLTYQPYSLDPSYNKLVPTHAEFGIETHIEWYQDRLNEGITDEDQQ